MSDKPTASEVAEKLRAVGKADQIALHLEDQGITGLPGSSMGCAIANYVKRETGRDWASVGGTITTGDQVVENDRTYFLSNEAGVQIGPHIHEFIARFDDYQYPNLLKKD